MNPPTPAIVAQSAVRRLPRVPLLLLCAAYLLPGLVGRGPWKSADVTAFGYMAELANGTGGWSRWLDPLLLGLQPETPALLPYWIGAWAIRAAPGFVNPDLAVRTVFALMLWMTFTATWYAVYHLARTPAAQPVAFAFGGEARPKDYARAIADGALLALLASLGLAQLGHETTPALAQLFFSSMLFYGVAALPFDRVLPPLAVLVGLLGTALSGAPMVALLLGVGSIAIALSERGRPVAEDEAPNDAPFDRRAVVWLVLATLATVAVSLLLHQLVWKLASAADSGKSFGAELRAQLRLLLWFTWPTWPLALWTLWRWRRQLGERHVALPIWFGLVPLAATLTTHFSERSLLLALPAAATLAAFALPTFRRSASALIDWFTLLFFSGLALIIWAYWLAMQADYPPKMAASVDRLVPGFEPSWSWLALAFALLGTFAWIWLVRWRTGRHRAALWKSLVLPAGGTALCWLLANTLWLPALDHALSYAPQVRALKEKIGSPACVSVMAVPRAQIAALRHHGQLRLENIGLAEPACPWLVAGPDAIGTLHLVLDLNTWRFAGTLRRSTSASDDLLLYERLGPRREQ